MIFRFNDLPTTNSLPGFLVFASAGHWAWSRSSSPTQVTSVVHAAIWKEHEDMERLVLFQAKETKLKKQNLNSFTQQIQNNHLVYGHIRFGLLCYM